MAEPTTLDTPRTPEAIAQDARETIPRLCDIINEGDKQGVNIAFSITKAPPAKKFTAEVNITKTL